MVMLGMNSALGDGVNWLSQTLWGAVIAALGYVGKLVSDSWLERQRTKRERRTHLIELQSLLRSTKVSFEIQHAHTQRLLSMLRARMPGLDVSGGYDQAFAQSWSAMVPEEKELHSLIRSITINSVRPGNSALVVWFSRDSFFKAQYGRRDALGVLADELGQMQIHVILWNAKYEMWIPDHPEHALVYMADEKSHGARFPVGLDSTVAKVLTLI
jgi:hypothetical protein